MKKKIIALLCALTLCVPNTVHAEESSGEISSSTQIGSTWFYKMDNEAYQNIFKSGAAAAYLSCQPIDALCLNSLSGNTTPVLATNLTASYTTGYINLPRLKSGYFYELSGDSVEAYGLSVGRTAYPTLSWDKEIAKDAEVTLNVKHYKEGTTFYTTTLHFNEVMAPLTEVADLSDGIISNVMENFNNVQVYNGDVYGYNPSLHRGAIITPVSVAFTDVSAEAQINEAVVQWGVNPIPEANAIRVRDFESCYYGPSSSIPNATVKSDYDVRSYAYIDMGEDVDSSISYFSTDLTGVEVDYSKLVITETDGQSAMSGYSTDYLAGYVVATDDKIELHRVKNNPLSSYDELTVIPTEPAKVVTVDTENFKDVSKEFGALSAKSLILMITSGIASGEIIVNPEGSSGFDFKYAGEDDNKLNIYETSIGYYGYNKSIGVLELEAPDSIVSIKCWAENIQTGADELVNTVEINLKKDPNFNYTHNYNDELYRTSDWYTDTEHKTKADVATWLTTAKHGDALDVYCYPEYIGGTYKVVFYNDATESSSEGTFETRYQPTLPKVETRKGYLFKNWVIVDTIASTDGTPYSGETFKPVKDKTYTLKTFWDIQGIITNIQSTKTEYYVGDSIDKSKVIVTVQTDNKGTVKTLNTNEFSISPATVSNQGSNQIQVTYLATGATGTFTITGKPVEPTKITATYSGSSLKVGDTIPEKDLSVKVHYNNGKSEAAKSFTYSPKTIKNAGVNSIKIDYGSLSTTVSIKGVAVKEDNTTKTSKLEYISANYTGSTVTVGEALSKSSFRVYAHYSDGKKTVLSSSDFTVNPTIINSEGRNVITISYSGKSCSLSIDAKAKSSTKGGSSSSGDSSDSSSSDSESSRSDSSSSTGSGKTGSSSSSSGSSSSSSSSSSGSSSSSSGNSGNDEEPKGDPSTGANVSSSDKGTSSAYINGNNVLDSYVSHATSAIIKNDVDIMKEIQAAGASASSVKVTLYNGAANNYITPEMLEVLKEKGLTLDVIMLDADTKSDTVANWTVRGSALDSTDFTFNPNIIFESKNKGSGKVTFVSVNAASYPKGFDVSVAPPLSLYESGELVRAYSVNSNGGNARLYSTFKWGDSTSNLKLDIYESNNYALSNEAKLYENGTNLLDNVQGVVEDVESTEESTEVEEESVEFDWGEEDDSTTAGGNPQTVEPVKKNKSILPFILIGVIGGLGVVGTIVAVGLVKRSRAAVANNDAEVADYNYDEIADEIGYDEEVESDNTQQFYTEDE